MGQYAQHVVNDAEGVRRLEALIHQLPNNARVCVTTKDKKRYQGLVCIKPTMQAFRTRDTTEGLNGILRLQDPGSKAGEHRIWLDQITQVVKLDSISSSFEA